VRSAEPGAYPLIGSFIAFGTLKNAFDILLILLQK
jgi:hypothetical protein